METHGQCHPLFVVKGSCHGLEIGLDSSHVPFGAVVLNSQSIRRILMINSGDIGARYVDQNQYMGILKGMRTGPTGKICTLSQNVFFIGSDQFGEGGEILLSPV